MAHNPTRDEIERLVRTIRNPDAIVAEVERARCLASVTAYNDMIRRLRRTDPCPSLGAACIAGYGWMEVYCHGCRSHKRIDLAGLNVHPQAPLLWIATRLRCKFCGERGPTIQGLHHGPAETLAQQRQREFGERTGGWEGRRRRPK